MFELIDYKPEHAMELLASEITQPNVKIEGKVDDWAIGLGEYPATTGVFDGRIVSCGGIVITCAKHRGEAWVLLVKDIGSLHIDPKLARDRLYEWIVDNELVRVEVPLRADFAAGISYAQYQGFEYEATLKDYYPPDVDALMYVIIREVC